MQFKDISLEKCLGWQLAHSIKAGCKKFKKGTVLDQTIIEALKMDGLRSVYAFKLESSDIGENDAADHIAKHVSGNNVTLRPSNTGRADIFAAEEGLVSIEGDVNAINAVNPEITLATAVPFKHVQAGERIATIKIIPYGIAQAALSEILSLSLGLSVKPFANVNARLISTDPNTTPKTFDILKSRLCTANTSCASPDMADHTVQSLSSALLSETKTDLTLIIGKAATSDIRDVIPQALLAAGGEIIHLGMPVEPGNLLMLGKLNGKYVLGLPGCARSPLPNGLDMVMRRIACGLQVTSKDIMDMGIGGLLHSPTRPDNSPESRKLAKATIPSVILLAAGRSARAGTHKLMAQIGDETVIKKTLKNILAATNTPPLVVAGFEHRSIETEASDVGATTVFNENYSDGMASSIIAGLRTLDDPLSDVLFMLADMPFVKPETLRTIIDESHQSPDAGIIVPTFHGKRGNPVFWRGHYQQQLIALSGDVGGRQIMRANEQDILEVPVEDPGILIDLDTPDMLARFGAKID